MGKLSLLNYEFQQAVVRCSLQVSGNLGTMQQLRNPKLHRRASQKYIHVKHQLVVNSGASG